jgi:hypothetical protein
MSKGEKIKLKGRELAARLTGILTHTGGISWKPPVDEQDRARRLFAGFGSIIGLRVPERS